MIENNNRYRPEIDGLRAIAIIGVLLYHAGFVFYGKMLFPGGFLGVDVFFVLSGYLLTGVIVKQVNEGDFKFGQFYYNRTKRILPALFFVFVVTLPFAFDILLIDAAKDYILSILTAILSVSNIFFWLQDSYIAEPSAYKPFLHTWSLAVEEQFYLIVPAAVFLLFRFCRAHLLSVMLIAALTSLMIGNYQSSSSPEASFYLIHTRFWELLAGSILAIMQFEGKGRFSTTLLDKIMPSIGFFMILNSFVFFDDAIKHPSYLTLFPVLGTMIMIWYTKKQEVMFRVLSSKFFVFVGVISYSLYLWHWPILVFYRVQEVTELNNLQKLTALSIAVLLSIFTYYVIEVPFRRRLKPRFVVSFLLLLLTVILLSSIYIFKKAEVVERENALKGIFQRSTILQLEDAKGRCQGRGSTPGCQFKYGDSKEHIILVGDSHAGHIMDYQFNEHIKSSGGTFSTAAIHGCPYSGTEIEMVYRGTESSPCNKYQLRLHKWLLKIPPATLIISGRYSFYLSNSRFDNQEGGVEIGANDRLIRLRSNAKSSSINEAFSNSIEELTAAGHKIVLIYPIPEVGVDVVKYFKSKLKNIENAKDFKIEYEKINFSTSYSVFKSRTAATYKMLDDVKSKVLRVYPEHLFCSSKKSRCFVSDELNLFYFDDDHLAPAGANILVNSIFDELNKH